MMVWVKKMGEIKITQKVFNKVIDTLSKDTTINNQQWDIILEKSGTPKWLLKKLNSSNHLWLSAHRYGRERLREMERNSESYGPTLSNVQQFNDSLKNNNLSK
jgi:hypothetical protein